MKWIKYQIFCNDVESITLNKKIGYSEENLLIAQREAVNGEYTIEEDEKSYDNEPIPIEQGGTSAKTLEDAQRNLDIPNLVQYHGGDNNNTYNNYKASNYDRCDRLTKPGVYYGIARVYIPNMDDWVLLSIPMFVLHGLPTKPAPLLLSTGESLWVDITSGNSFNFTYLPETKGNIPCTYLVFEFKNEEGNYGYDFKLLAPDTPGDGDVDGGDGISRFHEVMLYRVNNVLGDITYNEIFGAFGVTNISEVDALGG